MRPPETRTTRRRGAVGTPRWDYSMAVTEDRALSPVAYSDPLDPPELFASAATDFSFFSDSLAFSAFSPRSELSPFSDFSPLSLPPSPLPSPFDFDSPAPGFLPA